MQQRNGLQELTRSKVLGRHRCDAMFPGKRKHLVRNHLTLPREVTVRLTAGFHVILPGGHLLTRHDIL